MGFGKNLVKIIFTILIIFVTIIGAFIFSMSLSWGGSSVWTVFFVGLTIFLIGMTIAFKIVKSIKGREKT